MPPSDLEALAEFDFDDLTEQAIREQWIYPLLRLLGYGLGTPNIVDIPSKLKLAPPLRALGHHSLEMDYHPKVLGIGLWIIEAKRPSEDPFDPQHLGQAWCYATDPRVAVPLIVMTNGRQLGVFDLTHASWDEPVLRLEHGELPERFEELRSVLGARQVADFVRRRQLSHLRTALSAQVEEEVLSGTVEEVKKLCEEVRPQVRKNRAELWWRAHQEQDKEWRALIERAGVGAWADMASSPFVPVGADIDQCVQMIRELPSDQRASALDLLERPRMMYALRIFRLAVALRLVDDEGCGERARQISRAAVREHALGFPENPLDAAAHRFELALVPLTARIALAGGASIAQEIAEDVRQRYDSYEYVRLDGLYGLKPDRIVGRGIDLGVRKVWSTFEPWEPSALDAEAVRLRELAEKLGPQKALQPGQIGDLYFDLWLKSPPLVPTTRNVLVNVEKDPDAGDAVKQFARELREEFFAGEGEATS